METKDLPSEYVASAFREVPRNAERKMSGLRVVAVKAGDV